MTDKDLTGGIPDWNEADRLTALRAYGILDTDREAPYEDFVRLAQMICATRIAVINLIDADRQWFKAEIGLGTQQTPLDISICAHAILQRDVFIVPDTALDPRFVNNPLIRPPHNLRFYAGALLLSSNGLPIGTLCVLDDTPRPDGLTEAQKDALLALARQVMVQMDMRLALEALTRAESALGVSAQLTHDILASIDDPFFVVDANFELRFANNAFCLRIGRLVSEVVGQNLVDLLRHLPDYANSAGMVFMRSVMERRVSARHEIFSEALGKSWVDVAAYPITGGGLAVYAKNIDARKQLEQDLETALSTVHDQLAEKELLMLETHHRVKNSLQMVQSLLTLQARNIADPEIAQKVAESAARVHIFGALHETLYRIADGTHVDLAAYLAKLVADLNAGIGATLVDRPIRLQADRLRWPASEVSLVGLVLTELVTNALKYGRGAVDVAFTVADGEARLSVADEGDELPPDFQPTKTGGMGMRLISRLLRDKDGQLSVDRSVSNTRFLVTLKAEDV